MRERQSKLGIRPPGDGTAVVHLRLGDVVRHALTEEAWGVIDDREALWKKGTKYLLNSDYYTSCAGKMRSSPPAIDAVTIVYSHSHGLDLEIPDSVAYRDMVAKVFSSSGLSVTYRSDGTPDDDFVYMCSAKSFVQGGGGYSEIAARCSERYHNTEGVLCGL